MSMNTFDPEPLMRRKMFSLCLLTTLATHGVHAGILDRDDLLHRVVGHTLHFQGGDEQVYEFLDPAGAIRGESSVHGAFTAHWRLLDDRTICFESADPMASGCVGIELAGSSIRFIRRDGVVEGPFEILAGNPRKL
jgi:hypothetical protein